MISVDDYFKENPEIEHAHSKTLWALLRFFSQHPKKTFGGQKEMVEVISEAIAPITQAAMSTTLKKIANEILFINNSNYHLCKKGGLYGLFPAEKGMPALFRLGDIYQKKRYLIVSDNMIAFNLLPGKADLFVSTLKYNFDESAFFAFDIRNDQLVYVLFDTSNEYGKATHNGFIDYGSFKKNLFEYGLGIK